jgi:hypothetical protein
MPLGGVIVEAFAWPKRATTMAPATEVVTEGAVTAAVWLVDIEPPWTSTGADLFTPL